MLQNKTVEIKGVYDEKKAAEIIKEAIELYESKNK
jgi:inorganic pyrophosphatase